MPMEAKMFAGETSVRGLPKGNKEKPWGPLQGVRWDIDKGKFLLISEVLVLTWILH